MPRAAFRYLNLSREMTTDTGGAGRWRGQPGTCNIKQVLEPVSAMTWMVSRKHPLRGLNGGDDAAPYSNRFLVGTDRRIRSGERHQRATSRRRHHPLPVRRRRAALKTRCYGIRWRSWRTCWTNTSASRQLATAMASSCAARWTTGISRSTSTQTGQLRRQRMRAKSAGSAR